MRDNIVVDIPAVMVDNEVEVMLRQMESRFARQGLKLEDYLSYSGKTLDDIKEEMRPEAENNIKTELMLDTVAEVENISVEPQELDAELTGWPRLTGSLQGQSARGPEEGGQLRGIEQVILHRKTIDFLVEANKAQ